MGEKEKLIEAFKEVAGRYPANLNEILNVMSHPHVIKHAKAFLQVKDNTETCKKFQAPWNCALEAEAYSQTITNGWSGNMGDIIAGWCLSCRTRIFGEDPEKAIPMDSNWLEEPVDMIENPWLLNDEDPCMMDVDGCGD